MIYQIVSNQDDWEALYLNGKLVIEGHRLSAEDILNTLDVQKYYYNVSSEWTYDNSLPDNLSDIPAEALMEREEF